MKNDYCASWDVPEHLETFSAYTRDLALFTRYRNAQIYNNLGRCMEKILPFCNTINEVGVGGGRSFSFLRDLLRNSGISQYSYLGYDISKQCVDFCNATYGRHFEQSSITKPNYRSCDLLFFFDVLVHSEKPLEFLDAVSLATSKYLCFQTPTRDIGETEFNIDKSCRIENGFWIPWIVFNVENLIEELKKRDFVKFLVIKKYECFALGRHRYLPKEMFLPDFPSARTSMLAIKERGLTDQILAEAELQDHDVNILLSEEKRMPRWVRKANRLWQGINKLSRA